MIIYAWLCRALSYVSALTTKEQLNAKAATDIFITRILLAYQAISDPTAYKSDHPRIIQICTTPFRYTDIPKGPILLFFIRLLSWASSFIYFYFFWVSYFVSLFLLRWISILFLFLLWVCVCDGLQGCFKMRGKLMHKNVVGQERCLVGSLDSWKVTTFQFNSSLFLQRNFT